MALYPWIVFHHEFEQLHTGWHDGSWVTQMQLPHMQIKAYFAYMSVMARARWDHQQNLIDFNRPFVVNYPCYPNLSLYAPSKFTFTCEPTLIYEFLNIASPNVTVFNVIMFIFAVTNPVLPAVPNLNNLQVHRFNNALTVGSHENGTYHFTGNTTNNNNGGHKCSEEGKRH